MRFSFCKFKSQDNLQFGNILLYSLASKATAPFTSVETKFAGVHEEEIVAPLEIYILQKNSN